MRGIFTFTTISLGSLFAWSYGIRPWLNFHTSTNFRPNCRFTGYINRLRGYHTDRLKLTGFERGLIHSYYYALPEHKMRMRQYWPVSGAVYSREFPMSWRDIDQGIDELWEESSSIKLEQ